MYNAPACSGPYTSEGGEASKGINHTHRPRAADARCFRKTYRAEEPAIPRTNRVMALGPLVMAA